MPTAPHRPVPCCPVADLPDSESSSDPTTGADDGPRQPAPARTLKRGPLVGIAAGVVVVVLIVALLARAEDDALPATTAAPTVTSFPTMSGGTDAAGPIESQPVLTTDPVSGTTPQEVTFAPGPTAPPNTHPLPPSPFTVAQPNRPGPLQVYATADTSQPKVKLPNPVQVSPSKDPSAVGPLVLLERRDAGNGFLEVFLPTRPNGSTGFIRASDVSRSAHNFHIEIRLGQFNLQAFKGTEMILNTGIATAAGNTPTPGGLYYTNMLLKPPPNTPYGAFAYGLSGHSEVYQVFDGGDGQFAIHGTNDPSKIGQKVSHGCIRMRDEDITRLVQQLPLGVPVLILN